ncbi:MAG: SMC family ATPase [Candidatus Microbacterium phytovorans]|uniref:Nuclease SbcCD subunit C n=1 Tax=Candidatus Microbacterium phytovorans TaxID=3121374 RepID=A0AAJ6B4B9_9MICO|nr:SMC family ATPase [Microbacterium sp.]WEK12621.1 MAG: SMC family ATPase [Microbacterium sp.]
MKLHRLDLTGFGPFREHQRVDFDAFDGDGVFLISGRTGAGKSCILDGVSFALYGTVPRYEGGERRLRSDHSFLGDPTEVRLEFTAGERRLRVTRAPEYDRPAKRGGGLTTEPQRAELEELVGDTWIGRAAKPREVALLLDEILGLNAQQFQQVILLAQNRFSRFLLATAAERQTLLRTLFGSRRFEKYRDDLEQRRKDAQRSLDTAGEHARTLLDLAERLIDQQGLRGEGEAAGDLAARRAAVTLAGQRASYRLDTRARERAAAEEAAALAERALADATAQAERLTQLAAARAELAEREADAPRIAEDKERLTHARSAEALRAPIDTAARAQRARDEAVEAERVARDEWETGGGAAGDDLHAIIDALTGDLALWAAAAEQEAALPAAEARLSATESAVAAGTAQVAELDAQQALLPAERERIDRELGDARLRAARADDLRGECQAVELRRAAAEQAAALAPVASRAEADHAIASAASAEAATTVTVLLQQRLRGHAAELAARLVDGEPCAVCGATAHPHPAEATDAPVTDDDLTAAEEARDRAAEHARRVGEEARAARDALTEALARAGGDDLDSLDAALTDLRGRLAAAKAAQDAVATLERQRTELDDLAAAAVAERDALRARVEEEARLLAAERATLHTQRAQVEAARGGHASVADRVAEATARRDRARTCLAAQEQLAERTRAADAAVRDRDERVAASAFADVDAVTAALLGAAEQDALDERIVAHAQALGAVRARLLDLELATVDATEVDLPAAQAARDQAASAFTAAIEAERDARAAAQQLDDLLRRIDDAYAEVAAVADDADVVTRLADTVAGRAPNTMKMDLETFVLAAELEEIVAAANLRLTEMSAGRYTLHHSDAKASHGRASGLGIDVLDAHTGRLRSPQSLSGGETFLASLALALGLAEVVTNRAGGLRLDTLFVDEGFGSLDPETLDLAMRTLDELRAGGRTVGVISHVEAMKEQLPAQVIVETTPEGPSIIRQDVTAAVG